MLPTEGRLSREEEERLWILSIVPLVPIVVGVIAYFAHLKSIGIIPSFQVYVSYGIMLLVLFLAIGAGIYEVTSSFRVKKPVLFRVKRFLSRLIFASAFAGSLYATWVFLTFLLSSVLSDRSTLVLSLVTLSFLLGVLLSIAKTRWLIKKLTQEDSQP